MKERMMTRFAILLSLCSLLGADAPPDVKLTGKVVAVSDGDTLTVLDSANVQRKIRLAEIDAPETAKGKKDPGQPFGEKSKDALAAKCLKKTVTVRVAEKQTDIHGRVIGTVYLGKRNLNHELVAEGLAWQYTDYSKSEELKAAQLQAQEQRLGLWAMKEPEAPWKYRKKKRQKAPAGSTSFWTRIGSLFAFAAPMMSFSNYWEKKILDHVFGKASYTAPSNIYVAVSTANPADDNSGIAEPSGNNYARVSTSPSDWNAATSGAGTLDNANAVTFPQASGSWGTLTHFALFDASSGGNLLGSGALTASKAISTNDTLSFAAGALVVTLD